MLVEHCAERAWAFGRNGSAPEHVVEARIRAPALLVWGEHDWIVPLEVGEQIRDRVEGAELVVIAGAGHNPMWERPGEFNRLVGEFLLGEADRSRSEDG